MANGIDTLVHAMDSSPPQAPVDGVFAQTELDQLSAPNHPVLSPRKVRNCRIDWVFRHLPAHYAGK